MGSPAGNNNVGPHQNLQKGSLHKNEHHHFTISTKYNTLNWENTAKRADIQVFGSGEAVVQVIY